MPPHRDGVVSFVHVQDTVIDNDQAELVELDPRELARV